MAIFNQSTLPWVTAVQSIADAIGASGDTEMLNRAHRSLRASFQFLGGKFRWDFMRTEAPPQAIAGTFAITGISASAGQASAAAPAGHGFQVDDVMIGSGFVVGTRISATAVSGFGVTTATTGLPAGVNAFSVTAIRDMYSAPSDMRIPYVVQTLGNLRTLRYVGRRFYDRTFANQFASSTPEGYDLFTLGARSKIRLIPPPQGTDTLLVRYYRRFFLASASAMTSALDIPEDYEEIPVAWAKWHFLTDKGEGHKAQATTWLSLAQDGLKTMVSEQSNLPDDDVTIMPGHMVGGWPTSNDTRSLNYDYS